MRVFNVPQRSEAWYALRLGNVTGSGMPKVMAVGAKGQYLKAREDYKRQLVGERLSGIRADEDTFVNSAMKWGISSEPIARMTYQLRTGNKAKEIGFVMHDELAVGVSPDMEVNGGVGVGEIKCLITANHLYNIFKNAFTVIEDEGDVWDLLPEDYKWQVVAEIWLTDAEYCDFVGYDSRLPVGLDLFVIRLPRNEELINQLESEVRQFLQEVDEDVAMFMKYLPVAKRACRVCGTVYVDKLSQCPAEGCYSTISKILEIVKEPDMKLTKAIEELVS